MEIPVKSIEDLIWTVVLVLDGRCPLPLPSKVNKPLPRRAGGGCLSRTAPIMGDVVVIVSGGWL